MLASGVSMAASTPGTAWEGFFGGTNDQAGNGVWQTDDNGFIIVGTGPDVTSTGSNMYLTKVDWQGNVEWNKDIGGNYGYGVRQTDDGGYIATGMNSDNLYLVKMDVDGNKMWEKTFQAGAQVIGHAVLPADNGYIVVGQVAAGGSSEWDIYLLKTDSSGNKLWDKIISTTGDYYGDEMAYSIWQNTDGTYIIGGLTNWGYNPKPALYKVDASGNLLWNQTYLDPEDIWANFDSYWNGVQTTKDGGYIYAGAHGDKAYLLKVDANGNRQWSKIYDYPIAVTRSVQQTWDDGYVLAGYYKNVDQDADQALVIRTDANGNELWHATYGGQKYAEAAQVLQIGNGSFVVVGWTKTESNGKSNVYMLQLDKDMTPVPNAQFIAPREAYLMDAGKFYKLTVTMTNNGTMPWTFQDGTILAPFYDSADTALFSINNYTIPIGTVIRPGQSISVDFTYTAPAMNGTYHPAVSMYRINHGYFGEPARLEFRVVNGTPDTRTTPTATPTGTPTSAASPTAQPTAQPSHNVVTPTPTVSPATGTPVPGGKGAPPCLPSLLLPTLIVGLVAFGATVRSKAKK